MEAVVAAPVLDYVVPPNHLQLPDKDGELVENFQEHGQSELLTSSIRPHLAKLFPNRPFCIGKDSGIYFRVTDPPLRGCKAPDWFIVPDTEQMLDGTFRRSFVMWYEESRPLLLVEYASGNGREERDTTPNSGKFWVYERAIAVPFYAIFLISSGELEMYHLILGHLVKVAPNAAGRFPVEPLGVELGVWRGKRDETLGHWLRFWDSNSGALLPDSCEIADAEKTRADAEKTRADAEKMRADNAEAAVDDLREELTEHTERTLKLAERLRAAGIDPDSVA